MDTEFSKSFIKFMNRLNITYDFKLSPVLYVGQLPYTCVTVNVYYKGKKDYVQSNCYRYKKGQLIFFEGNLIQGVKGSVLSFLGDEQRINDYFKELTKLQAKERFEKHFNY